jgi:hypothetical protein
MSDLQPFIGPLIALFGTVVVAGTGLYQWKKQNGNPNRAAVAEARRTAAETLWAKLEELNLELRSKVEDRRADLRMLTTELNATFLKNSLYLDDTTQRLANDYLEALGALAKQIEHSDADARDEWSATVIPDAAMAHGQLLAALTKLEDSRDKVKRALLRDAGA